MPCRINRRRLWSHRLQLEAMTHGDSVWTTLTYSDESLPKTPEGHPTLRPRDIQLWLKRFRQTISPQKIRFFLVGEYGDLTQRPHYHAALFGIGRYVIDSDTGEFRDTHSLLSSSWQHGHASLFDFDAGLSQYTAGYVTKKMTQADDPRLLGRYPEFARMSNRPGIGAASVEAIADVLFNGPGYDEFIKLGDVPRQIKIGGKTVPLGRYLRNKLRDAIGMDSATREKIKQEFFNEMSILQKAAYISEKEKTGAFPVSYKEKILSDNKQKILNLETRTTIFEGKKSL